MTPPATPELLLTIIEPIVTGAGLDLEDLTVARAGSRSRVQILIDRDGGVTLDECAQVSRRVGVALDEGNPLGEQAYVLEVSSPGTSRPLTLPRHFRRNVGRLLDLRLAAPGTHGDRFVGRLIELVSDASGELTEIVLDLDGEQLVVDRDTIRKAVVQVELSRAADASLDDVIDADANATDEGH